ncbi:hypothetical protein PR048_014191 [Dryococelus australis]|uniref:Uncharacterized protein n=1 Tax=Dryococelus australis TaxID=614101 RepID=A0ABQ9HDP3_9NEOP|nr:hypothetical protein PR048_014191 [Dryococelus australis]
MLPGRASSPLNSCSRPRNFRQSVITRSHRPGSRQIWLVQLTARITVLLGNRINSLNTYLVKCKAQFTRWFQKCKSTDDIPGGRSSRRQFPSSRVNVSPAPVVSGSGRYDPHRARGKGEGGGETKERQLRGGFLLTQIKHAIDCLFTSDIHRIGSIDSHSVASPRTLRTHLGVNAAACLAHELRCSVFEIPPISPYCEMSWQTFQDDLAHSPQAGHGYRRDKYIEANGGGDSREDPPTNGLVRRDSYMRKFGVTRPGIEPGSLLSESSRLTAQPPWPHALYGMTVYTLPPPPLYCYATDIPVTYLGRDRQAASREHPAARTPEKHLLGGGGGGWSRAGQGSGISAPACLPANPPPLYLPLILAGPGVNNVGESARSPARVTNQVPGRSSSAACKALRLTLTKGSGQGRDYDHDFTFHVNVLQVARSCKTGYTFTGMFQGDLLRSFHGYTFVCGMKECQSVKKVECKSMKRLEGMIEQPLEKNARAGGFGVTSSKMAAPWYRGTAASSHPGVCRVSVGDGGCNRGDDLGPGDALGRREEGPGLFSRAGGLGPSMNPRSGRMLCESPARAPFRSSRSSRLRQQAQLTRQLEPPPPLKTDNTSCVAEGIFSRAPTVSGLTKAMATSFSFLPQSLFSCNYHLL